jgi:NitT/TauT family transport system substrate-binding protein
MKKFISYFASSFVLISLLAGCATATPAPTAPPATAAPTNIPAPTPTLEPIHLKVSVRTFISFAPLFIARDEGYFAEQGLEVELIDFSSSASFETIPLLVSREVDAAGSILDVSVFNAIAQGSNLKYVADRGFMNPDHCATDAFVISKARMTAGTVPDASEIKGMNIGIQSPGGSPEYIMDVFLAQNGLTQDDIQTSLIPNPATRVESLASNAIDVSVLTEPWITRAQSSGAGELWIPYSDIVPNISLGTVVFGPGILEDKPEAGTRFMIAYLKAVKQFNEGKTDRNVQIIADYTQLPPEAIKGSCWASFQPSGVMNQETMLAFQTWANEHGYLDQLLDLDQFWTSQFLDEAAKEIN